MDEDGRPRPAGSGNPAGRPGPGGGRRARLAAPWIVGGLTGLITAVTTSLEAVSVPAPVRLAIVGGIAVLAGVAAWGAQQGGAGPGPAAQVAAAEVPAQLPPVIAHFTGRDASLSELRAAVADGTGSPASPLVVSVHGLAGVGKSALAARFAHEIADAYPDGRLYFDLRGTGRRGSSPRRC